MFQHKDILNEFKKRKDQNKLSENTIILFNDFFKMVKDENISKECFESFKEFFMYQEYDELSEHSLQVYINFLKLNKELSEDNLRQFRVDCFENDAEYVDFVNDLKQSNRSESTISTYFYTIRQFTEVINLLPMEYINEAKIEQIPFIDKVEQKDGSIKEYIITPNVEETKLKEYMVVFKEYYINKGLKSKTIHNKLINIRTFCNARGIKELPKSITEDSVKNKIPLTEDIIRNALDKANKRAAALIAMAGSTGIRSRDLRSFNIDSFLKSIKIQSLEELFRLDNLDIVGYWEFMPLKTIRKKMVCQVCHSKETTQLIVDYLQERVGNGEILTPESPLFATKDGNYIAKTTFTRIFTNLNPRIHEEEVNKLKNKLNFGIINQEKYVLQLKKIPYFHAHALRSYFISQITKGANSSINLVMESHRSNVQTHKNYIHFTEEEILEYYDTIEKYLTFNKKTLSDDEREQIKEEVMGEVQAEFQQNLEEKDKEIADLKNLLNDLKVDVDNIKENNRNLGYEDISNNIRKYAIKHKEELCEILRLNHFDNELINYAIDLAKNDDNFHNNEEYLNNLFILAKNHKIFNPTLIEDKKQESLDKKEFINDIYDIFLPIATESNNYIKELGLQLTTTQDKQLNDCLKLYAKHLHKNNKTKDDKYIQDLIKAIALGKLNEFKLIE